ncbi:MAG: molybdopterin-dependent oxidoreductase [Chloroflexi bacterium]|nr:molybdopterin-dependent oxidoreductase [Chloroflexota bacterium]
MADVTLTIDGREVTVPRGTYIIEAARRAGVDIPNLCYHPELRPFGACRMCVVEIAGRSTDLFASCATPVRDGMQVFTQTPRVQEARRILLDMFLIDHPLECPTCDKSGDCRLQDYTYAYAKDEHYSRPKRFKKLEHLSPVIDIKRDRCVLCGLCVRVCDEIIGAKALAFANRGLETVIDSAFGRDLTDTSCVSCGQCINVCPVGCLLDRTRQEVAPWSWEMRQTDTICYYCGLGCSLTLESNKGEVVRVTSREGQGLNKGLLCVKGKFRHYFIHRPERLATPLIRNNGNFVQATWDEALDLVSRKLEQHRDGQFGALASSRATNEDNYIFQKFVRVVMGSNNIDHRSVASYHPSESTLGRIFGSGAPTNSFRDIYKSGTVFLVGADVVDVHPVFGFLLQRTMRQREAKLIVLSDRWSWICNYTDVWLKCKPGTEAVLLNGLASIILQEGRWNREFVEARTEGFAEWQQSLRDFTPEKVSQITGVRVKHLYAAARYYAKGGTSFRGEAPAAGYPPSSIYFAESLATDPVVSALANLALLTGNVGREGGGIGAVDDQNNGVGAFDMGASPSLLPGYQDILDPEARGRFESHWSRTWEERPSPKVAPRPLPFQLGLRLNEMLDAALDHQIKAMYIMGYNPVLSHSDPEKARRALESLDFLVVQDIWLTDTAQLADVVLPACSFAEKDGTFTNGERRVQRVRKALEPIGESKPDWVIIAELATRMGYRMSYRHPSFIMNEIAQLVPIYGGISYERLETSGLQWPCPKSEHPGTPVLYQDGFSRGLASFTPAQSISLERPAEDSAAVSRG